MTSRVFAKSHLLSPKELKHNLYLTECVLGKTFFNSTASPSWEKPDVIDLRHHHEWREKRHRWSDAGGGTAVVTRRGLRHSHGGSGETTGQDGRSG